MDHIKIRNYQPKVYAQIEKLWEATGLGGAKRGDNQQVIERSLTMGGKLFYILDVNAIELNVQV